MFLDAGSGTCLNCASLIVDCVTCAANVSQAAGVECTACADGFYIDGDLNCTACPATCLTCNSPTDCVDCVNSYSLLNGSCACDSAAQMYDLGNECAPCYAFINLCLECSGQGPSNVSCLSCPSGTYLSSSNDSCIACPDNCDTCDGGGCLNCTSGFNATAGSCVFLDTCQSFSGMDSNCLDCANSTSTNNATNITTTTELCLSCQAGFFLFQQTACVSCPSTCATCTSYFSCLTCQPAGDVGSYHRYLLGFGKFKHGFVVRIIISPGAGLGKKLLFGQLASQIVIHNALHIALEHLKRQQQARLVVV